MTVSGLMVRAATLGDLNALARLHAAVVKDQSQWQPDETPNPQFDRQRYLRRRLGTASMIMLVAERSGEVLGYVDGQGGGAQPASRSWRRLIRRVLGRPAEPPMFLPRSDAYLANVYVAVDARGAGVGAELVQAFMAEARRRGCARVHTDVLAGNDASLRMFEHAGLRVRVRRLAGDL